MRKIAVIFCVLAFAGGVRASWYWPFGSDEGPNESPRRISELMEPATKLIDEASDLASDGKVDASVEKYREALYKLDDIERENPERAKGSEFATLRNKRAYVNAAIDSLLLGQVKSNAKAVAVSDTTELERKLAEERWTGHMRKVSGALMLKDMVTAKAELNEAFGCYTNTFARACVHNASAVVGFLSGDFDEVYRDLAKSKSCIQGYRSGDPFIDEAISNSLLRIRGLLADYREIVVTAEVVQVRGNVASDYISHLDYVQSHLAPYDFDSAKELYVAATNLLDVSTNVPPSAAKGFGMARHDFSELSSEVGAAWGILAHVEFPVLKEKASVRLDKANRIKAKNDGKESEESNWLITSVKTDLNRFERDHPEFVKSRAFAALRKRVGAEADQEEKPAVHPVAPPPSPRSAKSATKRERAMEAIASGNYAVAEGLINEMLAAKPNGAMALNLRAAMEMKQGRFDVAEATLDQAIMSNPRNYSAYYNLAMLLMQKDVGNKASAKRYYETGRAMGGPEDAVLEALIK